MYNRIYKFFNKNNLIYPLQFGFRRQYSTFHALISLCGIFIDLQKTLDNTEHDILLAKLEHSNTRGMANNWFKSYRINLSQLMVMHPIEVQ